MADNEREGWNSRSCSCVCCRCRPRCPFRRRFRRSRGGKERGGCHLNLRRCWACWPILGLSWSILRLCSLMLVHLKAMLTHLGAMLANLGTILAHLGGYLGPSWSYISLSWGLCCSILRATLAYLEAMLDHFGDHTATRTRPPIAKAMLNWHCKQQGISGI